MKVPRELLVSFGIAWRLVELLGAGTRLRPPWQIHVREEVRRGCKGGTRRARGRCVLNRSQRMRFAAC